MIRTFDVRLNAAHPELPLMEATAIVGSPSTANIYNVPAQIGSWDILKVFIEVSYPNGSTVVEEAIKTAQGIWTATVPQCAMSGRVKSGFTVIADGEDENGEEITGYILGVADFAVYTRGLVVRDGETTYNLRYFDTPPAVPAKGDVAPFNGIPKLYDGYNWISFADDVDLSDYYTKEETDELFDDYYTKDETDAAIDALAAYYITYTAAGAAFPTRADLLGASTYYSGGVARTPTRNDYAVVLADETHGGAEYRYIYGVAEGATEGQWEAQYPIETNDYTALSNKPKINNVELAGNKSASDLGLATAAQGAKAEAALPKSDVVAPSTSAVAGTAADAKGTGDALAGKVSKAGDTMTGGLTVPNLTVGSRDSQYQVGTGSTAEGENVSAVGMYCHAEGTNTYSSGYASHAEGFHTTATTNTGTHAEGCLTTALGEGSHAEGGNTETKNEYEHAEGRYNNSHRAAAYNWGGAGNTLSSTGFGSAANEKKNAVETMQDGKTFIYGVGGYDGTNPTNAVDLATSVNGKLDKSGGTMTGVLTVPHVDLTENVVDEPVIRTRIANGAILISWSSGQTYYKFKLPYITGDRNMITKEDVESIFGKIAPTWDDTATYAVDDIVYWAGAYYRSLRASTGENPAISTAWTRENLIASIQHAMGAYVPLVGISDITGSLRVSDIVRAPNIQFSSLADASYSFNFSGTVPRIRSSNNLWTFAWTRDLPYEAKSETISTAETETIGGETIRYAALTPTNRTSTTVAVLTAIDELRITMPEAPAQGESLLRDFYLRVEVGDGTTAMTAPAIVLVGMSGQTITIEADGGTMPTLADGTAEGKGVTLLYLTETKLNTYLVKAATITEVA